MGISDCSFRAGPLPSYTGCWPRSWAQNYTAGSARTLSTLGIPRADRLPEPQAWEARTFQPSGPGRSPVSTQHGYPMPTLQSDWVTWARTEPGGPGAGHRNSVSTTFLVG